MGILLALEGRKGRTRGKKGGQARVRAESFCFSLCQPQNLVQRPSWAMFAGQIDAASLSSSVSGTDRKDIEISPFKEAGQASGKRETETGV